MCVEQRVQMCRLLEKMQNQESYSKRIGIENSSTFHGEKIHKAYFKRIDNDYNNTFC